MRASVLLIFTTLILAEYAPHNTHRTVCCYQEIAVQNADSRVRAPMLLTTETLLSAVVLGNVFLSSCHVPRNLQYRIAYGTFYVG